MDAHGLGVNAKHGRAGGKQRAAFAAPGSIWFRHSRLLGSGLGDQSQKMTVAARAMADKKTVGHLS